MRLNELLYRYSGDQNWYESKVLTTHDSIGVWFKDNLLLQEFVDFDINDYLKEHETKEVKMSIEENLNQNYDYTFSVGEYKFTLFDAMEKL